MLDTVSGLGRIGELEQPSKLHDFAVFVKKALQSDYLTIGDAGRKVKRVAVCGGAGADLIGLALAQGADTLVTGDVKYHEAQQAVFSGLNIIDAGHQRQSCRCLMTWPTDYRCALRKSIGMWQFR